MSDTPTTEPKYVPIHLRPPIERHTHVSIRLKERAGIEWTPGRVLELERKIRFVRGQLNHHKEVPNILPTKIGEDKEGSIHFYRVMIAGQAHTFVFSQRCRGLVSYRGLGELTAPTPPFVKA